jgi:hypothetical protein
MGGNGTGNYIIGLLSSKFSASTISHGTKSPSLAIPNGTHHDPIAFVFSERFEALLGSGIDVPRRRHG